MQIPLFPLNTVLFPGGPLPLRIFEPRYLDMLSRCMKDDAPFGVLLIREGEEVGPATTWDVGTLAKVTDWYQGSDGILGVTAIGAERFRLLAAERQPDGLNIGEVEIVPDLPSQALPAEYAPLVKILAHVLDEFGLLYEGLDRHYDDAVWVAYRVIEVLPVPLEQKQACLESCDILDCLKYAQQMVHTSDSG
jgi:Lon protease-like protein